MYNIILNFNSKFKIKRKEKKQSLLFLTLIIKAIEKT